MTFSGIAHTFQSQRHKLKKKKIFAYPLNSGKLSFFNASTKEELSDCFLQAKGKSLNICDQGQMVFHPSA